jgi:hypothetical protein
VCCFYSCVKNDNSPAAPFSIITGIKDTKGLTNSSGPHEIISLPDNTFWIHYKINGAVPFRDKIEHYDSRFKLLDSSYFDNYCFGKFYVNGNNDIIVPVFVYNPSLNGGFYRFLRFDNQVKITAMDSSMDIYNKLKPLDNFISFKTALQKLTDGKFVFAFHTNQFSNLDSAHIIMAAFPDPIASGIPTWVNRKKYYDYPHEIYSTSFLDLAPDDQGNYYLLGKVNNNAGVLTNYILRKHSGDGTLLWQTNFFLNDFAVIENTIFVDRDRVLVGTISGSMYVFDANGIVAAKPLKQGFKTFFHSGSDDGYIALSDSFNRTGHFAKVMKLDHDFNLLQNKLLGNQGTNYPAMGKLSDGTYVLAAYVETPDLKNYSLVLYHLNDQLEFVK